MYLSLCLSEALPEAICLAPPRESNIMTLDTRHVSESGDMTWGLSEEVC